MSTHGGRVANIDRYHAQTLLCNDSKLWERGLKPYWHEMLSEQRDKPGPVPTLW